MKPIYSIAVVTSAFLGCGQGALADPAIAVSGQVIWGQCAYTLPGEAMRCGTLTVPEDYARPQGRMIRLPVAVLPSHSAAPKPDPIVYLNGGPGASSMGWLGVTARVPHIRDEREVIVLEPRGAPAATPTLACDDDKLRACYKAFRAAGIDLEQYNNVNTARDVEALRRAMKIEAWNLWGISYGTTWAMYVMRQYPEGIRSVVLDSPTAPGADIARADVTSFLDGMSRMFANCAADAACASRYGDLRTRFLNGFDQLNRTPMRLTNAGLTATFGPRLTGDIFVQSISTGLQSGRRYKRVPAFIDAVLDRDEARIAAIADVPELPMPENYALPDASQGLTQSIYCGELHYSEMDKGPGPTTETWPKEIIEALVPEYYRHCEAGIWPIKPIDRILLDTVRSDIPTLVLLGEQDPITSKTEADRALAGLTQGQLSIVPATTHGTTENEECAVTIMQDFVNNPAKRADESCFKNIPPLAYRLD